MPVQVIISKNERELGKILEKFKKPYYVYFGEKDPSAVALLALCDAREVSIDTLQDDLFKQEFVKEYVNLIGKLGKRYDSLVWWATFTAAKNKFVSRLLPDLFVFSSIARILDQQPSEVLVIINPPEEIISSIEKYCRKHAIGFVDTQDDKKGLVHRLHDFCQALTYPLMFIIRIWGKILLSKIFFSKRMYRELRQETGYYVLRSPFYERTISNGVYRDSFFGILPDYLARHKKVLILAGSIGDYFAIARKIAGEKSHLIVTEECFLSFLDPLRTICEVGKNPIRISETIDLFGHDVTDIIRSQITNEYRFYIYDQFIFTYLVRNLASMVNIDTFTTTYENNPWEKVCFKTLKEISSDIHTIGYQHAALSKSSLNMVLSGYEKDIIPMPDRIITIGEITKKFLVEMGGYDPARVREGCGLRFAHLYTIKNKKRTTQNTLLVTPEGIMSESVTLANFVHSALQKKAGLRIVLRPHPALPFEKYKKYLNFNPIESDNFLISANESVKKDLDETDIVVYRGSTLALEAIKMGIPVIYLALSDIISVDPLFDGEGLNWMARTQKELVDAVTTIYGLTPAEYESKNCASQAFISRYIAEITEERLKEFIL
jgi:hypothetical protein